MGFRKGCAAPTDQNNVTAKTGNGVTITRGDVELADPRSLEKVNEVGCIAKDTLGAKSPVSSKRKNSALVPMNNCLRNENEDLELKLTLEEAQGLLQPPPEHIPSVVVIEGFEFEEYENAPVLGKPRICAADKTGEMVRRVQCEICFKWRKLPANVLLPPRWTCFDNPWDAERSLCSTAQELTSEQLENVLPSGNSGTSKKLKADLDNVEVSEALDGLGNLAVLGYGEAISSSQVTTKHPRHRPECSCIQPPNGKGHQHKQTVERREKNQCEKEAQDTREQPRLVERLLEDDNDDAPLHLSPFKGQIDLNIQPEREEQVSPGPHPKLLKDCNKQQTPSSSICNLEEISNELSADEVRTAMQPRRN